ncbi:MAG: hypothetical protein ABS76_07320 [Pelagibacterium sp. SCN 64-44]|nr:MAG: hypothetical protein ABS76_07320 [Pelagibacterium sp. SCN 64-44]
MVREMVQEWAEDIKCLRLPMPAYDAVNAWILGAAKGQVVVDTGMPGPETAALWEAARREGLLQDLDSVLCTHAHIDHVGQVGALVAAGRIPLFMSRPEYADVVHLSGMDAPTRRGRTDDFLLEGGFSAGGALSTADYSILAPFPGTVRFLEDGEKITLAGIEFEVLVGGGHSRAAICLFSRARKLLLSGDQILAGSGPQISVLAERAEDNTLGAYLAFLDRLDALPDDLIVLPGHGGPIHDFKAQIRRIREGHHARLARLSQGMAGAMSAAQMVPLAFSETTARRMHARLPYLMRALTNFLVARGQLHASREDGTLVFSKPD